MYLPIKPKNQSFYTADIGSKNDLFLFNEFSIDYMIAEATHITFNEIVDAVKIIDSKKCYLVHINDEKLLKNEINKLSNEEKSKLELAYDALRVIPKI